jgi:RNA polymerase sigma-70 factor (ECF subfamily)
MAGFSTAVLTADIARGLKRSEPEAQAEAYRILAPRVMGMAQRILGDRGLAEEVVQDTFVSLIERAHTLRDADAAVGWVRQTAINHCLMRLRSPWQQRRVGDGLLDEADPGESAGRTAGLADLERALGTVNPETRMVLWLHDVEGYTHQEIGALFGKTDSYSKSQLARGYQKIVGALSEKGNGGEKDDGFARPARSGVGL